MTIQVNGKHVVLKYNTIFTHKGYTMYQYIQSFLYMVLCANTYRSHHQRHAIPIPSTVSNVMRCSSCWQWNKQIKTKKRCHAVW